MRKVTIYAPDKVIQFEEKKDCQAIVDVRSEYPVVKVYIDDRIHIFKGLPYKIEVDKLGDAPEPGGYQTRQVRRMP